MTARADGVQPTGTHAKGSALSATQTYEHDANVKMNIPENGSILLAYDTQASNPKLARILSPCGPTAAKKATKDFLDQMEKDYFKVKSSHIQRNQCCSFLEQRDGEAEFRC